MILIVRSPSSSIQTLPNKINCDKLIYQYHHLKFIETITSTLIDYYIQLLIDQMDIIIIIMVIIIITISIIITTTTTAAVDSIVKEPKTSLEMSTQSIESMKNFYLFYEIKINYFVF